MSAFENALKAYITATNTHRFEEVEKSLHPHAVYWFTDETCTTMEQIRAYFEHAWNTVQDEIYSAHNVYWLTTGDDNATCIYTFHYEGIMNGKHVTGSGRATNVFTKVKHGEWLLIHEHLSAPSERK
ncbi:BH1921 [Halalkalibacterium halodurans C-125]|uniref:BH1921 protein n=1 Tax=Halalkalibacterium halodurans (strain ATCC BAA-125 / DSM 18197 / FERM 7344 / JCM 9153 / C-125) TaxID=272558 RepID=Q9KBK5_HALH5|nr:nuclear transport factor 2 family protein [Halalkalibacterium halodurans]BAB05640.1 BH1921 [Halalkalibacterium halodurans C-125]